MDDYYYLLDGRSWIDPVTNQTHLHYGDDEATFNAFLKPGHYGTQLFPPFMHEGTHHWCFLSPVGTALALLKMRARRRAAAQDDVNERDFDVLEDILRYETCSGLMRPLAEGLALFAEFDAEVTESSSVVSSVSIAAYKHFTRPGKEEIEAGTFASLREYLVSLRLTPTYAKRKAAVLLNSLDCNKGGYLCGYLTVKNLWGFAVTRHQAFIDRDFFMMYLKTYLYDDFGFVAALLDPAVSELDACNQIAIGLQQRIHSFLKSDFSRDVPAFEEICQGYKYGQTPDNWPCLNTTPEDFKIGQERFATLVHEIDGTQVHQPPANFFQQIDAWAAVSRRFMKIAEIPVVVRKQRPGWINVLINGKPALAGAPIGEPLESAANGSLRLYIELSGWAKVAAVFIEDELVMYIPVGQEGYVAIDDFRQYLEHQAVIKSTGSDADEKIRRCFIRSGAGIIREHAQSELREMVNKIYQPKALMRVTEAELEQWKEKLAESGLYHVFDYDLELIGDFALLSLAANIPISVEFARKVFVAFGRDLDSTLARISECEERHEFPLIAHGLGEGLFSFV